jgi:hypothetical protein
VCVWRRAIITPFAKVQIMFGCPLFLVFNYRISLQAHQIKGPPKIVAKRTRRNLIFLTCGSRSHSLYWLAVYDVAVVEARDTETEQCFCFLIFFVLFHFVTS